MDSHALDPRSGRPHFDANGDSLYLSTSCLHGDHDYCKNTVGRVGSKIPSRCKFCGALCVCPICNHPGGPAFEVDEPILEIKDSGTGG